LKTKMLAAVLLIVISLVGCSSSSSTTVKEGIVFSMLAEEDFPELMGQSGPLDLQVRILREDDTSAYFAVNLPYNTDIGGIDLLKNGRAVINLVMRPGCPQRVSFHSQ
jgi:predicted component of type VI protein secretion system